MAQREGSVYLYLFIVACVLFLVMTVMFFVDNAEKQERIQEIARLKVDKQKDEQARRTLNDEIRGLRVLIAGPDVSESWPGNDTYMTELKEKAEKAINEALTDLKLPKQEFNTLVAHYGSLQDLFLKLRQARDEAFTVRAATLDVQVKDKAATDAALAELKKQHATTLTELQDLQARFEDLDNKSKAEKAQLVKDSQTQQDECTEKILELNRKVNADLNQIRALEIKIAKLQEETFKEKSFEDVEPDGKILSLASSTGKGWVDLGRENHLRNGIVFRVFQYVKGGKKLFKGRVEVQKVDEATSEVRVIEEADSLNPIVQGDFITSPFYDPKAEPVFVFAGNELDSKDVTREYLVAKMRSYGGQIRDKVDINTSFLVAIKNFENTPEYKTARDLSVKVIRERDLLEFIGR